MVLVPALKVILTHSQADAEKSLCTWKLTFPKEKTTKLVTKKHIALCFL